MPEAELPNVRPEERSLVATLIDYPDLYRQLSGLLPKQFTDAEANFVKAIDLAQDCHAAYMAASPTTRRRFNQFFFEQLGIDSQGDSTPVYTREVGQIMDKQFAQHVRQETARLRHVHKQKNRGPFFRDHGSNKLRLARPEGLEPPTS